MVTRGKLIFGSLFGWTHDQPGQFTRSALFLLLSNGCIVQDSEEGLLLLLLPTHISHLLDQDSSGKGHRHPRRRSPSTTKRAWVIVTLRGPCWTLPYSDQHLPNLTALQSWNLSNLFWTNGVCLQRRSRAYEVSFRQWPRISSLRFEERTSKLPSGVGAGALVEIRLWVYPDSLRLINNWASCTRRNHPLLGVILRAVRDKGRNVIHTLTAYGRIMVHDPHDILYEVQEFADHSLALAIVDRCGIADKPVNWKSSWYGCPSQGNYAHSAKPRRIYLMDTQRHSMRCTPRSALLTKGFEHPSRRRGSCRASERPPPGPQPGTACGVLSLDEAFSHICHG